MKGAKSSGIELLKFSGLTDWALGVVESSVETTLTAPEDDVVVFVSLVVDWMTVVENFFGFER